MSCLAICRINSFILCLGITNLNENLLTQRNKELEELINLINIQSSNIGKEAITEQSTSFDAILQIIIDFHTLEHKPTNILDVTNVLYTENEDFNAYYTRVRRFISNCLKKKGCKLKCFNNKVRILNLI